MMRKKVNKNLDFNKRAVSAVVATVLIILITVVAVGIIWKVVIPMINNIINPSTACFDALSQVGLGTEGGYTCLNETNETLYLQITRGEKENFELAGIQVIVSVRGNTYSTEYTGDLPGPNEDKVINVTNKSLGLSLDDMGKIEKVEIAPIIKSGGTTKNCGTSASTRVIPTCSE